MMRATAAFTKKVAGPMKQSASIPPTYGKLLKRERERLGLSQQALAERVDATFVTISNWERGKTMPGPYHRRLLSNLFGKSLKELGLLPDEPEESSREQIEPSTQETHDTSTVSETPARIWNVPYARNSLFTGREDVLEYLHETFLSYRTAALTQPQAISGLGGIGKTQTAVEYAYRYRNHYQSVFWARADSRELLVSDFVTIANLLKLPQKADDDQNRVVSAVKRWLESNSQWLLILDNADDLEMVSEFIPSAGQGHTLLTTRTQATGTIAQSVEIEKMEPTVGALFLLRRAKLLDNDTPLEHTSGTDQAKAKEITEMMDGLPLALDQAGAYIEETACGLDGYLTLYKTRRAILLQRRGRLVANHAEPVATTWSLSFEKVEQANPAAAELLRLCAFLHPDTIPEEIIIEGAPDLGPVLQPVVTDPIELNDAINELRRFSLVRRDADLKLLNIHRLVQAVLKDRMDDATQRQWAERVVRAVNRTFPDVDFATWHKCQLCLPHAQVCAELIEMWNITFVEAPRLLNNVGQYLQERGLYSEAESLLQQALTIRKRVLGSNHPDVAQSLNDLAWLYNAQGKYVQAEPFFLHALAIRVQVLGPNHPDVTQSLHNLATLYRNQGKYTQAEPFLQRALAIREQVLEPNHPKVAESLNNLALLYHDQGKYEQAEPLHQRALAIRELGLGPKHPHTAVSLHNLARLYRDQGKYEQAELLHERALAICELGLGPNHPLTAKIINNLARVYHDQGKYEQAELLHEHALTIREQVLGPNHPDIAYSLNSLARLYHDQGKYEQAELLHERALTIREQGLGPNHPLTATCLNNLARLYLDQGKYERAESLFQRALTIREQSLGPKHPDLAITLENYAKLLRKMGREAEAVPLEERAKAIRAK